MLDLDGMKQRWAEHDRKLDQSIRLNRQVLTAVNLNGTRTALERMTFFLAVESVAWLVIAMALGGFIYEHAGRLRFALAGGAVDVFAAGMLAAAIGQTVMARRVDYSNPIAAIQKQLEALRVLRIRITQWALLAGAVVWAPCAIVICKAVFGIDDYSQPWLWANVLFGLSLIPLVVWVSKRFGERMGHSPFLQRLMRDIAGHNLTAANEFLASLSQFENESQGIV